MKYDSNLTLLVSLAWVFSILPSKADVTSKVELVGITLGDKDQVTVETRITNLSKETIRIDPRIWVRTATLKGQFLSNQPIVMPGEYRVILTLYADLITNGVFEALSWHDPEGYYPPPPLVLKPGADTKLSVKISMSSMLCRDFMTTLSKDLWIHAGLYQSEEGTKEKFPVEFIKGNFYKLEKPKEGETSMVLIPIKASF